MTMRSGTGDGLCTAAAAVTGIGKRTEEHSWVEAGTGTVADMVSGTYGGMGAAMATVPTA